MFGNQFLHACCFHNRHWCAGPTGAITIMDVCSTIFWQAALSLHHYHTPLTTDREFRCWKYYRVTTESHYKILRATKFPVSLSLDMNFYPEQHLTVYLIRHLLYFTPTTIATSYRKIRCFTITSCVFEWSSQRGRVVRSPRVAELKGQQSWWKNKYCK